MSSPFSTRTTSSSRRPSPAPARFRRRSSSTRHQLHLGPPQRRGLRLAPPFRERLGKIRKPDGQQQNDRHQAVVGRGRVGGSEQTGIKVRAAVTSAPSQTTNITGLRIWSRGSNFLVTTIRTRRNWAPRLRIRLAGATRDRAAKFSAGSLRVLMPIRLFSSHVDSRQMRQPFASERRPLFMRRTRRPVPARERERT